MAVYLDCNATTPVEKEVRDAVVKYLDEEFGNAGSRTHEYGSRAEKAVKSARESVANVTRSEPEDVIFTSGATESNNLSILGLEHYAEDSGKRHVVTTAVEHKAVLEPFELLSDRGFEVEFLEPNEGGWVPAERLEDAIREDTSLVSTMSVNNETGVRLPVDAYAEVLAEHDAYFHVDAAQGFGKEIEQLRNQRIDLISISAHKIYGPKGVGALVARRRKFERPPLKPLQVGGGQERGYRPGTLPVQLIAGLGKAAELALSQHEERNRQNESFRETALQALKPLDPVFNGDQQRCVPHTVNLSFPGVDSEALMLALKPHVAISNGSACTSSTDYEPSHVLEAMGLSKEVREGAVRMSWCHMTPQPDWEAVRQTVEGLL